MESLKGQLLIASPKLFDPNFSRSVVLLVQHNEEGALGVILNRPLEATIQGAWEQVSEMPCNAEGRLHQGGPCEGPLMVVHADEGLGEVEVLPGIHFSTERDAIQLLVCNNDCQMKFFVGYAGWAPGQLEGELADGGWMLAPATADSVFSLEDNLWVSLVKEVGQAVFPKLNPKVVPQDPSTN